MKEKWIKIENYPFYEVSNLGRVKSKKRIVIKSDGRTQTIEEKILKQKESNCGYLRVGLYNRFGRKFHSVHRLVALAFIENKNSLSQVNHKDGNKKNNSSENLEWTSCSENHAHAFKIGLKSQKGEKHQQARLTEKDVVQIREMLSDGFLQKDVAKRFGIKRAYVSDIKRKKAWSHV